MWSARGRGLRSDRGGEEDEDQQGRDAHQDERPGHSGGNGAKHRLHGGETPIMAKLFQRRKGFVVGISGEFGED
jgi:hypothetical protein